MAKRAKKADPKNAAMTRGCLSDVFGFYFIDSRTPAPAISGSAFNSGQWQKAKSRQPNSCSLIHHCVVVLRHRTEPLVYSNEKEDIQLIAKNILVQSWIAYLSLLGR